jgi:DNA-3-methyladenine glycosylase
MILGQNFFFQKTDEAAKALLGKTLHFKNEDGEILSGRIVETEAYTGINDPACHTFGDRKTERTKTMYLEGGHAYVYLIYGMYNCLNFVTRHDGEPEAVLIRALEPVHKLGEKPRKKDLHTNGPGKLCRYFGITKKQDGLPLWKKRSGLWVEDDGFKVKSNQIISAPRIGIDYAGEAANWPLRFYLKDSFWVSRPSSRISTNKQVRR